jgi:hypothetical protein
MCAHREAMARAPSVRVISDAHICEPRELSSRRACRCHVEDSFAALASQVRAQRASELPIAVAIDAHTCVLQESTIESHHLFDSASGSSSRLLGL